MNETQLIELLTETISLGLRHPNYDRTIAVRRFARMISTGDGQDDEVEKYRRFEDDDLKNQRKRLFNTLTKYALSRPRKYWKRMGRVEGIRRMVRAINPANDNDAAQLEADMYNFMPGESLDQWTNRTLEYYGVTDPNAWIVYDRTDKRNQEGTIVSTKVFPVVFQSENVINFQRSFGSLDWLIVRTVRFERVREGASVVDKQLEDYYLYAPGIIVRMQEVGKRGAEPGEVVVEVPVFWEQELIDPTGKGGKLKAVSGTKSRRFYQTVIYNSSLEVPADCVGVYFDEQTNQESFVPWFDPAEHVFKDLIRDKNLADVLAILYAYPRETVYTKACKFKHPEYGECVGGFYNDIHDAEHTCASCHGTGRMAGFTTEQAKIELILPDGASPDQLIELSKLSYTQPVDIALLEFITKRIDDDFARIMSAVFDSGLVQRPNNTTIKTATEVNSIMEGISDVLAPFGAVDSKHYELAFRVAAQYRGFEVEVDKSYPEDLKIEMLPDMVESFEAIKTAGVGYEATLSQRGRVFQKLFEGNPEMQKRIEARYKFLPFDDKSADQAAMIISSLSPKDPTRVLWTYWREIMMEVESADPEFYKKTDKLQKDVVDKKVEEFTGRMVLEEIGAPPTFNEPILE